MSSTIQDREYHDLITLVGSEIGGETMDTTTDAEREEARASVQTAALDLFPEIEAAELFPAIDEIAAAEYGIHW